MSKFISSFPLIFVLFAAVSVVEAQQGTKMPRIGYLGSASLSAIPKRIEAFLHGLRELGFVEGKNIVVVWRWA